MNHIDKLPLVSVVILNWNRYEDTVLCLQHVRALTYKNIEIVVVDNGSVDGSKAKLATEPGIVYVDNPKNRGFTGGHIDGLAASHGEFILLLNNDALISPDYLTKAMTHFMDDHVAVVGGRAYRWDTELPPFKTTDPYYGYQTINPYSGEGFFVESDNGHVLEVNNVSGSAVVVRRSVINEVGYLYDPFFAYFEETDLFARMKRAGYKVLYDPALHIWHKGGVSSDSYFQFYQLFKNRFIFAVRNFQTAYLYKFLYIYSRIGLSSLARQWQAGEQQTMRKAYAKAFMVAWLSLPRHLIGRHRLHRQLGASKYNEQLQREERGVSFLINLDELPESKRMDCVRAWLAALKQHSRHEVVLVTASQTTKHDAELALGTNAVAKVVLNRQQVDTDPLNIAWLSSKYPWIYASDSLVPPSIPAIEKVLTSVSKEGGLILQYDRNGAPVQTALYARRFLIRTGGFTTVDASVSAKAYLYWYATQVTSEVVTESVDALAIQSEELYMPDGAEFNVVATRAIAIDAITLHEAGRLSKFLKRNRHVGQLFSLLRWLVSPSIGLRLKLGRTRNLLLATMTLRRQTVATELRHIKNEAARLGKLNRYEAYIQAISQRSLRYYQDHPSEIPVFIICRDRISTLNLLLKRLKYFGLTNIFLIDNDSAFPPLLDYYKTSPFQVLQTGQNVGHKSPWESGFVKTLAPASYYIVTDPDVIPVEDCPPDAMQHLLKLHDRYTQTQKIGLGLKIDDLPDHYIHKQAVITWESQFWLNSLEPDVYEVPLDTTYALYKPFNYRYFLFPSIRTGGKYVARHLPWYVDNARVDPEEQYYRDRASGAVTSWTVETLDDTLQKELAKQPQTEVDIVD